MFDPQAVGNKITKLIVGLVAAVAILAATAGVLVVVLLSK